VGNHAARGNEAMSSKRLGSYGEHIKKIADAAGRNDQIEIIRKSRFKASLVDDPLDSNPDLAKAIENSRKVPRKLKQ
jgi:hypothetical protein